MAKVFMNREMTIELNTAVLFEYWAQNCFKEGYTGTNWPARQAAGQSQYVGGRTKTFTAGIADWVIMASKIRTNHRYSNKAILIFWASPYWRRLTKIGNC